MQKHLFDLDSVYVEGHQARYCFDVVLFEKTEEHDPISGPVYGWRGEGQVLPNGAKFVTAAVIYFEGDDDAHAEWPLNITPTAIGFYDIRGKEWWDELCSGEIGGGVESGVVNWTANGFGRVCAAQYCRK